MSNKFSLENIFEFKSLNFDSQILSGYIGHPPPTNSEFSIFSDDVEEYYKQLILKESKSIIYKHYLLELEKVSEKIYLDLRGLTPRVKIGKLISEIQKHDIGFIISGVRLSSELEDLPNYTLSGNRYFQIETNIYLNHVGILSNRELYTCPVLNYNDNKIFMTNRSSIFVDDILVSYLNCPGTIGSSEINIKLKLDIPFSKIIHVIEDEYQDGLSEYTNLKRSNKIDKVLDSDKDRIT